MKIYRLSTAGLNPATPRLHNGRRDSFYAFYNGMSPIKVGDKYYGWQLRYPVSPRDYPYVAGQEEKAIEYLKHANYTYVDLGEDPRGNVKIILIPNESVPDDHTDLILWSFGAVRGGNAEYEIEGDAEVLGEGYEVVRAGDTPDVVVAPAVEVYGPATLRWRRTGPLPPGQPEHFVAIRDEKGQWMVETD